MSRPSAPAPAPAATPTRHALKGSERGSSSDQGRAPEVDKLCVALPRLLVEELLLFPIWKSLLSCFIFIRFFLIVSAPLVEHPFQLYFDAVKILEERLAEPIIEL